MKDKFKQVYMNVAKEFAALSQSRKLNVGAILVKDNRILSVGYNGTPVGWDNDCEDKIVEEGEYEPVVSYKTKEEVIHAESNAILKVAASTESSAGAEMFCTHTPCIDCAKMIHQAGISKVYVDTEYNAGRGKGEDFLVKSGVEVEYMNETHNTIPKQTDRERVTEWDEGGPRRETNQVLVQKCTDPRKWYADKVGLVIDIIGEEETEYKAREDGGYINFISKKDAIRV